MPVVEPHLTCLDGQVFDLMDRDKGGSLGIEELKQLMEVRDHTRVHLRSVANITSSWNVQAILCVNMLQAVPRLFFVFADARYED